MEANAPEGLAPSDELSAMIKSVRSQLAKPKHGCNIYGRTKLFYENVIEGKANKYYSATLEYDQVDSTTAHMRAWLDLLDKVAESVGIEPVVQGNYDGFIEAYFKLSKPYDQEEVELAKHCLATGQYITMPDTIRFRKPIPFSTLLTADLDKKD